MRDTVVLCTFGMRIRKSGITPQYLLQLVTPFGMQFYFPVGTVSATSQDKKGNPRPTELAKSSWISCISGVMAHTLREGTVQSL